jgi:hypothetical protein
LELGRFGSVLMCGVSVVGYQLSVVGFRLSE